MGLGLKFLKFLGLKFLKFIITDGMVKLYMCFRDIKENYLCNNTCTRRVYGIAELVIISGLVVLLWLPCTSLGTGRLDSLSSI